ncbi:hypothetical protein KMS_R34190 [Pseudomonas sp. LRP2-20]|uniref:hypothetical protein n=1 Tax=Pseudomonas sp. LRP2-20 TaxID=2944234 RepID=UPI002185BDAC|nr:hypothetical protein [Pseudomonas sp. LRP2-20]BDM23662.1 hypothetical protein KMS_R34190 [Pseudomonas sp. LRP2-20]
MELQRHTAFVSFFGKYPDAERKEHQHENGKYSTFAVGLVHGVVSEGYLSINKENGELLQEQIFSDDDLAQAVGKREVGFGEALSSLLRLAVARAGAPAKSV